MAKRRVTWNTLLLTVVVTSHLNTAGTDQCMGGSNIFTEIPENSPNGSFVANLTDFGDPWNSSLQLYLSGPDSHWFYLEGKTIRLNVSTGKTLDREALNPPVLVVTLFCSEDSFPTMEYRVIIQVLNENDHRPHFQEDLLLPQNISELEALHSVVFTTPAEDGDGDSLLYSIDNTSVSLCKATSKRAELRGTVMTLQRDSIVIFMPDAMHFRIDLPNSGRVVLAQPLDFETKRRLEVVIHATETSTRERYKCTTTVHINVLDGDDQYPSFLPCRPLGPQNSHVCLSPIYTVNITEGETPEGPFRFQPGDIYAEDGDHDLKAAISYSILTGADGDRFHMDNTTGALTMQKEAPSSQLTSAFHLTVMAAQVNDPRKYAVSEVLVRVLAANHHPPCFSLPHHTAFVFESPDIATLLVTYGGHILYLHAVDPDFPNGVNPNLWYKLVSEGNHSQLFSVTRDGLLLARPNQLQAQETYLLQVIAQDAESGEVANTTVGVEVLPLGQAVPPDPSELSSSPNMADRVVVVGSLSLAGLFLVTGFSLGIWALRRWRQHQECSKQTALADEKHPNVFPHLYSEWLDWSIFKVPSGPPRDYSTRPKMERRVQTQGHFASRTKAINEPMAPTGKGSRGRRAQSTGAKGPLLSTSGEDERFGPKVKTFPNGRIPKPVMSLEAVWPQEPSQMCTENTDTITGIEVMPCQGKRTGEDHPEKPEEETLMGGNRRPQGPLG